MNENEMNLQEPVFEEPVVAQKPKSKKGLWIGLAALVAMVVIAAIVIGMVTSSPLGLLATGFRNSMEAMENDAYTQLMHRVSNGGSMEFSMDISTLLAQSGLPVNGTGSVKIYMNEEEQKTATTLAVQVAGQKLDASIFADQESVVLASDWLLGDKAYGVTLKDFVENFNKSVFGLDGAYSLGIEIPEKMQTQLGQNQAYAEDTAKIVVQLLTRLGKSLEENTTVEKEDASLTLGGEEVKTTAVIIRIDHSQLAAVTADMLEYLRTDENIKAYIQEYKDILAAYVEDEGIDAENFVEEIYQKLDEAAEDMDETAKEMEESGFATELTFYITKSGKQLIGYEQTGRVDGEDGEVRIYAGPDLKNMKELRFEMRDGDETVQATCLVKMDDEDSFMALLDLSENGEDLVKTDIRWDKQTGTWEVTATDDYDDTIAIRGTLEIADKELSAKLESIEAEGQKVELGIGMVLRAEDTMPEMPQYTDLLKMTEDEVTSLVNDLTMVFFQLAYGMVGV